jgi:thiamine biosynthesis protein ThiS
MQLTVNGKPVILEERLSVLQYVERLGIIPQTVAVEHNGEILKRERYGETVLNDGDVLEIVRMVGGGSTGCRLTSAF